MLDIVRVVKVRMNSYNRAVLRVCFEDRCYECNIRFSCFTEGEVELIAFVLR